MDPKGIELQIKEGDNNDITEVEQPENMYITNTNDEPSEDASTPNKQFEMTFTPTHEIPSG